MNAPQTVEEMQATLQQFLPGEPPEALRETAIKLMAALANPSSAETRQLWSQIEQATGKDLRAVFQSPESFGTTLLRALADGSLPMVSAPVEVATGQGQNGRVEGFKPAPQSAESGTGPTAEASTSTLGLPLLQSLPDATSPSGNSSRSAGGLSSSVQVSQATGLSSLGVGTELSNAALVTPFVLQSVAPDGQLMQSLDSRGVTAGLADSGTSVALSQGAGARIGTAALAPAPAPAPVLATAVPAPAPPLQVEPITVNEGSPFAVFAVHGTSGQVVRLTLGNTVDPSDDDAPLGVATANAGAHVPLQVYNGSQWVDYTPGSFAILPVGSHTLLVRTRIVQDDLHQGPRTFTLTAANADTLSSTGVAVLRDDGKGSLFPDAHPGPDSHPAQDVSSQRDDDRPQLSLVGLKNVSEGGFAVTTLHVDRPLLRAATVELSLAHDSTEPGDFDPTLVVFTNPADPEGSALAVTDGRFTLPPGITAVYVRVATTADGVYEGPESFRLTAGFVDPVLKFVDPDAANPVLRSGATTTDTAVITDDGLGLVYGPGGLPTEALPTDQRPVLSVSGVDDVSEGSPAVFFLTLNRPSEQSTEIDLALTRDGAESGDIESTLVVFTNPADPEGSMLTVTHGRFTLPPGVTAVYVRVATATDGLYEGPESFSLTAGFVDPVLKFVDPNVANPVARSGATATDTSTVTDDGLGRVYGPGGLPTEALPADQRPALSVSGVDDVSEGSPAVFSLTLSRATEQPTQIDLALSHEGTESGDFETTLVVFTNPADPEGSALTVINGRVTLPAGVTSVYVRATTATDGVYEGPESFRLTAGFVDPVLKFVDPNVVNPVARSGATASDTSTLTDDGLGRVYGPGGLPTDALPTGQRPTLSVSGVDDVSEGSPAVFSLTLSRATEQPTQIDLALTHQSTESGDFETGLVVFTNPADPEGSMLTVTNGRFTLPAGVTAVYVRTATTADGVYEGAESFRLTAGFVDPVLKFVDPHVANPVARSGAMASDTATVIDDGSGQTYGPGGLPTESTPTDQRPALSVSGVDDVSEGSPAVFSLTLSRPSEQPTEIDLALTHQSTEPGDFESTLVVFTNPADPEGSALTVTNGRFTLPPGVTAVYVRTATAVDGVYEGPESFRLTAGFVDPVLKFVDPTAANPVARSGATATDTSTVTDDGLGRVYGPGGLPTEALPTDQRPALSVSGVDDVSEGSPAVFSLSLSRATEQPTQIDLALSHEGTESGDFETTLVVFTNPADPEGSMLTVTHGRITLPAGVTSVYLRVATATDSVYEGTESFRLTAGFVDPVLKFVDPNVANPIARSGATATDTSTITDEGLGRVYGPGGLPTEALPTDQRPALSVAGVDDVSEGSPAVFSLSLSRATEQPTQIDLALSHEGTESGDFETTLVVFTNPADPVGSALTVTNGRITLPAGVTSVYVRATTATDDVYEGPESFRLTAGFVDPVLKFVDPNATTLVARSRATASDTSTIVDDGSGRTYGPGGLPTESPATDQRPALSVSGVDDISEGSPAVFTLALSRASEQPTPIDLALAHVSTESGDFDTTLVVFTNPADPDGSALTVTNGRFTLPAGVTAVYVRAATVADSVYEGAESFRLTASFVDPVLKFVDPNATTLVARSGATASDTATVIDDSTGQVYGPGGLPVPQSTATDDRPTLTVSSPNVNEAAGHAVFTVTLSHLSTQDLHFVPSLATTGNGIGHAMLGTDVGDSEALEYSTDGGDTWHTVSGGVTLAAGTSSLLLRTPVLNEGTPLYEGSETFALQTGPITVAGTATPAAMRNPGGAVGVGTVLDDGSGSVPTGITADDDRPTLAVSGTTVLEDGGWALFRVDLNRASGLDIVFTPSLANGTGTAGVDTGSDSTLQYFNTTAAAWQSAAAGVTIAAGTTSVMLRAPVVDDLLDEEDETFSLGTGTVLGVTNGSGASGTAVIADNDPSFSFDAQSVTVVEGNTLNFVVNRVSGAGTPVTLNWTVLVASADSSALPVLRSGSISFGAYQDQATISLQSVDDQRITDDQRLYLSLSTTDDTIRINQGTVSGTVQSNDAEIGIRSITASGPDSNGLYTYQVTVERTGALGFSHAVDWHLAGVGENPARNGDFVLPSSVRVEFTPNTTPGTTSDTQTFSFQAQAGLVADGQRTFEVTIAEEAGSAARVQLGRDASRGVITPTGAAVSIEAVTTNLIEGSAPSDAVMQTFRVTLSQAQSSAVVVRWDVTSFGSGTVVDADTADFGGTFPGGTVTIAAGQTSALIQFAPSPDSTLEPGERFLVDFSVLSGPAAKVGPAALGRIANDEASVQFAFATFSGDEGDTGTDGLLTATVSRSDFVRSTATVNWHVEAVGGATDSQVQAYFSTGQNANSQASGLPSGTLTLQPGQVQSDIELHLAGNNTIDATRNFRIVLDNPGTGTTLGSRTSTSGTILDDDARIEMASTTVVHDEGNSASTSYIEVVVNRVGDSRLPAAVSWLALGTGSSPTNAVDLMPNNSFGTLLFGAGESSATIRIQVRTDDLIEADEQLTVTLTGTSSPHHVLGGAVQTVVTLNNDDSQVSFDTAFGNLEQAQDEDGTGFAGAVFNFVVTRAGDTRGSVDVPWSIPLTGGLNSTDLVATSGVAHFAAGSSTATITVRAVSDRAVEASEGFSVVLAPAAGSGVTLGSHASASGVLINDDVGIQAVFAGAATEGADGATSTYTFTLSRSGDVTRQGSDIGWRIDGQSVVSGGVTLAQALSNAELASTTSGNLSWTAGDTSSRTITVTVNNDGAVEGDEAFALALSHNGSDNSQLIGDGTVGIVHDDDALISIQRLSAASVAEGAGGTTRSVAFRVTRSGDLSSTLAVDLQAAGVAGATGPTSVTFTPHTSSATVTLANGQTQTISLEGGDQYVDVSYLLPGDNVVQGDRNFTVTLANPQASRATGQPDQTTIDGSAGAATVAVTDDDDLIAVTPSTSTLTEGNSGNTTLTFTLTRSGNTAKETITAWRIQPGTGVAVDANDFSAGQENITVPNGGLPSGRVTFASGETSKIITVQVSGDTAIEADESLVLHLDVVAGNTELSDTAVTVLTDDLGYNVIARQASMAEGDNPSVPRHMVFDLVRAGMTSTTTASWALSGITLSDIEDVEIDGVSVGNTLSGSVSFVGAATGAVVRVRLVQDSVVESNETATFTLTDTSGESPVTLGSASTVITNDDSALSISATSASINEGTDNDVARVNAGNTTSTPVSFTVTRTGKLDGTTTVNWALDNTAGLTATDFAGGVLPSGMLSFAPGETSKTITVQLLKDWIGEADEVVTVRLSGASAGTELQVASANTTIVNDDSLIRFAANTTSGTALAIAEGESGFVSFNFTVLRDGPATAEQQVNWQLIAGNGITVQDFYDTFLAPGAQQGSDPVLPYGTLTFASSETSKTITIKVRGDSFHASGAAPRIQSSIEQDEPFTIQLTNPATSARNVGYSVSDTAGTAHAVIVNDDVRLQVTNLVTGLAEGRDPAVNGGDVDPLNPGVQRWMTHSVTVARQGDPTQAVSVEWFVDTPGFADRMIVADDSGDLPTDLWHVDPHTSAALLASGSYTAGTALNGVSRGVLSGLLSWAPNDISPKTLYFTAIANDTPEPDFSFAVKVRTNAAAPAESARIDEISAETDTTTALNQNFGNTPITLATIDVKRDEALLWISNDTYRIYDAATSSYAIYGKQAFEIPNSIVSLVPAFDSNGLMVEGSFVTATAGSDYTQASGSLSFNEEHRSRTVHVNLAAGGGSEERETFSLFLNHASGASLASDQANQTILDGDGTLSAYRVAINNAVAIEGLDSHLQFRVDFGRTLTQANVFQVTLGPDDRTLPVPETYQGAANGEVGDYYRYVQYSADGGETWKDTAPQLHFLHTTAQASTQSQSVRALYKFDNDDVSARRFDAWMDFSDLKAGQGYKVGGTLASLAYAEPPAPPLDTSGRIYVVVEADGAYIDLDNDGKRDSNENTLAFDPNQAFATDGGGTGALAWKDLVGLGTHSVTIQFNALPNVAGTTNQLALGLFGNDDRIEIDLNALAKAGYAVGTDGLDVVTSRYEGAPGHPAFYVRQNDMVATASREGVQYTTTLEGFRNAYGDGPPVEHNISLQFGSGSKVVLGQLGLGYGWSWPVSQVLANPNFYPNVSNGLLDQMSFTAVPEVPRATLWIPVRADAVINAGGLSLSFANSDPNGVLSGSYVGLADLGSSNALNTQALDFFRGLMGQPTATMANVQSYFANFDPNGVIGTGVKFLKFQIDWSGAGTPSWAVAGLDPSVIVAPQDGNWDYLGVAQDVTLAAHATTVSADIQLGARAAFDSDGAVLVAVAPPTGTLVGSGPTDWNGNITVEAGTDSVLIRTLLVDDKIDEPVETLAVGVGHVSGDNFQTVYDSGTVKVVDNDSPQITLGTTVVRDPRGTDYIAKIIDINHRGTGAPSLSVSGGADALYNSDSRNSDTPAQQDFTVVLRYQGEWDVTLFREMMKSGGNAQHTTSPLFTPLNGTIELDGNGQPTGYMLAEVAVPAGTYQLVMRSAVGTIAGSPGDGNRFELTDISSAERLIANSLTAVVGHVAPVIVAREVSGTESSGGVDVQVIAVGGDFNNGNATVDWSTVDGGWVDRTFVVSRERSTVGSLTAVWELDTPASYPSNTSTPNYVINGYVKLPLGLGAEPEDFVPLDGQTVSNNIIKGYVTFAEGQKEATITVRVRADVESEPDKDYRVRVVGEVVNGVESALAASGSPLTYNGDSFTVVWNPQDLNGTTYGNAQVEDGGYGRIQNDDRVFTVRGFMVHEGHSTGTDEYRGALITADENGYAIDAPELVQTLQDEGLTIPAGYSVHQFVVNMEGKASGAASVQWRLQVKGHDVAGFDVGPQTLVNGVPTQSTDAHRAEREDFLAYDVSQGNYESALGLTWYATSEGWMSDSKTLVFEDGQTQKVVNLLIKDDMLAEDLESFEVMLTNPQALQGSSTPVGLHPLYGSSTIMIADDDGETVKVEIGQITGPATLGALAAVTRTDEIVEGTGAIYGMGVAGSSGREMMSSSDWLAQDPATYPGTDNHTDDDKRIVLVFTRSDSNPTTYAQAAFEIQMDNPNFTAEGDANLIQTSSTLWRGIVDFAPGATRAYMVLRLHDDLVVEAANQMTVTLLDAASVPESDNYTKEPFGSQGGWDERLGSARHLADWNTLHRDPTQYEATLDIIDDDVRLWFGGFVTKPETTYTYDHDGDESTPSLTVDIHDTRGNFLEGDPAWNGAADQQHSDTDGSLWLKIDRAGPGSTVIVPWRIVLNGTANVNDFDASKFSSSYTDGDGNTVLVGATPITVDMTKSADEDQTVLENLMVPDLVAGPNKTFGLVLGQPTAADGNTVLYSPEPEGEGGSAQYSAAPTQQIAVTVIDDDVVYSIDYGTANPAHHGGGPLAVQEGDADTVVPTLITFDIARDLVGYKASSSVAWRVVPVGGSDVTASDFLGDYTVNGVAALPYGEVSFAGERLASNGTLVSVAEAVKTIELRLRGDNTLEFGEHFRIELYDPSIGHVDSVNGSIETVIVNDDTGLRVENVSVREQDSGDQAVTVTVTRLGDLVRAGKTVSTTGFDWSVTDIDTNATDHGTGSYAGTGVQMAANQTATHVYGYATETTTLTYNIHGDATVEGDETMRVQLAHVTGVDEVLQGGIGIVTVRNDDTVFSVVATPGFEASNQTVVEDVGGDYHFRITRSVTTPQDQTVTWSVVGAGGRNVVDAADFGGTLPSGTVTFSAGELYKDVTISAVSADMTVEPDQVFLVEVSAFGTGAENDTFVPTGSGAKGTIVNDDAAVFISDSLPIVQQEGTGPSDLRSYSFQVVRSGSPGPLTSTIDWALDFTGTGADANDFTGPTSGTLTFTTDGAQTVSVQIAGDAITETALQNFNILLFNGSNGVAVLTPSVQGVIGDDDYTLTVANATVAEGDGRNDIAFTVTRTGSDALPAMVDWALDFSGRTANAADFMDSSDTNSSDGVISGRFTLPAGVNSYTFYVPVQGDTQWEADETFKIDLTYGGNTASAIGTLTNDDEGFSLAAITPVSESAGSVTFRINRTGNLSGASTVDWSVAGSGSHATSTSGPNNDFASALSGTTLFANNEAYKDVTLTLVNDTVWENDETFTVTLTNPGPGSSLRSTQDSTAVGTVRNDDQGYFLTASTNMVSEDAGNRTVTFTITRAVTTGTSSVVWSLSNPVSGGGDPNAVQLADFLINGDAATSTAFTGTTVSFANGESSKTVTLTLVDDAVLESQALLQMTLSRATGDSTSNLVVPSVNLQVIDDDEKLTLVALSPSSINEGNSGTTPIEFKVTREGSSIGAASVVWTIEGLGAYGLTTSDIDHIVIDGVTQSAGVLTGNLTFAHGTTADKFITVYVKGDTVGEFNEAFKLSLSSPSTGTSLGTSSVTQTVLNDDPAVQLVMSTTQFSEGGDGDDRAITFQIVRTGDLSQTASVSWSLQAATSGNSVDAADFGAYLPAGLVAFQAGEASKTVTVMTAGDDVWEPNEAFRVVLGNPSAGTTIIGPSELTGTLLNDDVQVTIAAAGNGTVLERHASQTSAAQFTLAAQGLSSASNVLVSWHVEGTGAHPTNGADFVGGVLPTGQTSIPISAGAGTANLSINIAGDNIYGPDEQFKVVIDSITVYNGSNVVGSGSAAVSSATMTVLDDDLQIGLSQTESHQAIEGHSGTTTMRFYVDALARSANAGTMADVRVDYHVTGDVDSNDLSGSTGSNTALTLDSNNGRYYIGVTVNGDTQVEGTERFTLHLDSARTVAGGGVEVAQSGATVNAQVLDDDFGIQLVSPNLTQAEDGARFVFDVLRTGPTDAAMTVQWTVGSPALSPGQWGASANDFIDPATGQPYTTTASTPLTGSVSFAAGASTARFTFEPGHDALPEGDERFAVRVAVTSLDGHALVAQSHQIDTQVAVIVNDDPLPAQFDPAIDQQVHHPLDALA